jgi:GT2 family glycosyltransferase
MEIQIIIPWSGNGNVGAAYNRSMESVDDWVCFLDHDILNLNPNWYHIIKKAVATVGHAAGWITGVTNSIACPSQKCIEAPKNNDILDHMKFARQRDRQFGDKLFAIDPITIELAFSGFMILTHKKAWQAAGGFTDGFLGVDNIYFNNIVKAGFQAYLLPGLYMYHTYGQKKAWDTF